MECWSVSGHCLTSLYLLWVNLLDLAKFFNSQNLDYLQYNYLLQTCILINTFHIHTSLSRFFK